MSDQNERGLYDDDYGLVQSFFIDTDAYSVRDRDMFVCGYEFAMVLDMADCGTLESRPIHRENESRLRMALGKRRIAHKLTPHTGYEGCETWSQLIIPTPTTGRAGRSEDG